jgi:hypothetical protein
VALTHVIISPNYGYLFPVFLYWSVLLEIVGTKVVLGVQFW